MIYSVDLKHQGKKKSRSAKANKNKGRELEKKEARLEELREKLRKKLEDMKGWIFCVFVLFWRLLKWFDVSGSIF